MKRNMQTVVLAALAVFLWAGVLESQTAGANVVSRNGYCFNSTTGQRVDCTSGAALGNETSPLSDQNLTFASIINRTSQTTILTLGAGDSSAVLDTHRMRLGTLLLKCVPSTGVGRTVRLAVQVRTHLNGLTDSSSVFPIYMYTQAPVAVGIDSSNTGHVMDGSATAAWSGEFVVTINGNRNEPNTGTPVAALAWSYPNGLALPLQSDSGREFYSPWTSVRIRILSGPSCQVTASLIGTPL